MFPKSKTYFYEDKPLFGLDIDHNTLRVMQLDMSGAIPQLGGYGSVSFDSGAIASSVIVKPELIASATQRLFEDELIGDISTNRVAVSLPASRALSRVLQLPKMNAKDIEEAIQTEAAQYIPNTDSLYLDHTLLREDNENIEVLIVAMPKNIVDSYLVLTRMLGLEAVLFDTTIGASARLFAYGQPNSIPSVLVDFGADATDVTVLNGGLVVTSAVPFGEDAMTLAIAKASHLAPRDAAELATKTPTNPASKQLNPTLQPFMEQLVREIRRSIRYYQQRYINEQPIGQIVIMGGGARTPGLEAYLTDGLRLPARTLDLAEHISAGHLPAIKPLQRMSYVTAAGLGLANPAEVFA